LIINIFLINYLLNPLENKNLATLPSPKKLIAERKILVMVIAESIETKTPIPRVNAKPLINEVPNQKRIMAVIILEIFESRIENHALEKPAEIESATVLLERNSSFILSNIRTLASTAMPMEIINPAIPAAVIVTGINLNKVKITPI
jgi:hypothetical protein